MLLALTQRLEPDCFSKSSEEFEPGQSIEPIIVPKSTHRSLTLLTLPGQHDQQSALRGLRPTSGLELDRKWWETCAPYHQKGR
jgi:hypothetical protein